jgi:hypothetical protein
VSENNAADGSRVLELYGCQLRIAGNDRTAVTDLTDALLATTGLVESTVLSSEVVLEFHVEFHVEQADGWRLKIRSAGELKTQHDFPNRESLVQGALDRWHHPVAERTKTVTIVHAGVVAFGQHAVVLPGQSRAGKSTLVHALVNEGATYLSDEFAVFQADGGVHSFRKPISLRDSDRNAFDSSNGALLTDQQACDGAPSPQADQTLLPFGGRPSQNAAGDPSATVNVAAPSPDVRFDAALILFTQFREGATWNPVRLSRNDACIALIENTLTARLRPAAMMSTFATVVRTADTFYTDRPDLQDHEVATQLAHAIRALVISSPSGSN